MNSIQWTAEEQARVTRFVTDIQALVRASGMDALPIVLGLIEVVGALMVADTQQHPERLTCYLEALARLVDYVVPTPIAVREGERTHCH